MTEYMFPTIRLTLDSMRMQIINVIDTQYPDWLESLDQQIKDATSDQNFGKMLHEEISKALQEKMKWMVHEAMRKTMEDVEIREYLINKATEAFKKRMGEDL